MLVMMLAMQLMMIKNFFREFYIPKSNYINLDVQIQFVKTFLLKESLMSGTVYHHTEEASTSNCAMCNLGSIKNNLG